MAWYLSHFGDVKKDIRKEWAKVVTTIDKNSKNQSDKALFKNMFSKLEVDKAIASTENIDIKNRIRELVDILQMKTVATNATITAPIETVITKVGAEDPFDKNIWEAMTPLFEYFRGVYDPVFTIIDHSIQYITQLSVTSVKHNISPSIIPQLLTLLHVSNNITEPGVFKIINASKELVQFIELQQVYILNYMKKTDGSYKDHITKLPKVTLESFTKVKCKEQKMNYVSQFFIVDSNLDIPRKNDFMKIHNSDTYDALKGLFKSNTLYMSHSSGSTPMNVYELDLEKVDTNNLRIPAKFLDRSYFSKNKFKLEDLLEPNKIYNQSVLALSIFISFKEMISI